MTLNLGFAGLLTLIFVIAKLVGLVSWSWWLVFCPLMISFAVVSFLMLAALAIVAIGAYFADKVK